VQASFPNEVRDGKLILPMKNETVKGFLASQTEPSSKGKQRSLSHIVGHISALKYLYSRERPGGDARIKVCDDLDYWLKEFAHGAA
jgi:hypothetical protein